MDCDSCFGTDDSRGGKDFYLVFGDLGTGADLTDGTGAENEPLYGVLLQQKRVFCELLGEQRGSRALIPT